MKHSDNYIPKYIRELSIQLGKTSAGTPVSQADMAGNAAATAPDAEDEGSNVIYIIREDKPGKVKKGELLFQHKEKGDRVRHSVTDLLCYMRKLAKKLGRTPYASDINKAGVTYSAIYVYQFGSLSRAQQAAGLVPNKRGNQMEHTTEYLLNHLKELANKLGKTPSTLDIKEAGDVGLTTYERYFGSLVKAQQAAGLVPNKRGIRKKNPDK